MDGGMRYPSGGGARDGSSMRSNRGARPLDARPLDARVNISNRSSSRWPRPLYLPSEGSEESGGTPEVERPLPNRGAGGSSSSQAYMARWLNEQDEAALAPSRLDDNLRRRQLERRLSGVNNDRSGSPASIRTWSTEQTRVGPGSVAWSGSEATRVVRDDYQIARPPVRTLAEQEFRTRYMLNSMVERAAQDPRVLQDENWQHLWRMLRRYQRRQQDQRRREEEERMQRQMQVWRESPQGRAFLASSEGQRLDREREEDQGRWEQRMEWLEQLERQEGINGYPRPLQPQPPQGYYEQQRQQTQGSYGPLMVRRRR